jgi:sulfide:quinone oxidoreductase
MEHNLEKQLHDLEKKGIDRRSFIKILSAAGLLTIAGT